MLVEIAELEEEFKDREEIVFLGVHCAKFNSEKEADNLQDAIARYEEGEREREEPNVSV